MQTTDPILDAEYRRLAALGANFHGLSLLNHAKEIAQLIRSTKSSTILDYGCGRGDAYGGDYQLHRRWRVEMPTLYDPAFASHDRKPSGTFDGVICSDVLEHVPEELVDAVLLELFGYAERFVWMSVCCRPAKKHFENGQNMHVTVKPYDWWIRKVVPIAETRSHLTWKLTETE